MGDIKKEELDKLVNLREEVMRKDSESIYKEGVDTFLDTIKNEVVMRGINEIIIDINEYRSMMVSNGWNEYSNTILLRNYLKELGYETWKSLEEKSYVLKVELIDLKDGKMKKSKDYTKIYIDTITEYAREYIEHELE